MDAPLSSRRLAHCLIRQLRLKRRSRVLDVGCGNGDLVGVLRRSRIDAYGLFDGSPAAESSESTDVPALQPATLHQSIPFLAQSFDAVVVRATADYDGSLASPEACTATANLLAVLKPGGHFLFCADENDGQMKRHLAQFPGRRKQILLRWGGFVGFVARMIGLAHPGAAALLVTLPEEPISRLEWHRIAREAVGQLAQIDEKGPAGTADAPAA